MPVKQKKFQHGDTIMEVMFAIAVFATVSLLTMNMMNGGLNAAQRTLEITMARTAMDSQTTALNFIHNSYIGELSASIAANKTPEYKEYWNEIIKHATTPAVAASEDFNVNSYDDCESAIEGQRELQLSKGGNGEAMFAINPRALVPATYKDSDPSSKVELYAGKSYRDNIIKHAIVGGTTKISGDYVIREAKVQPRILFGKTAGLSSDSSFNQDENLRTTEDSLYISTSAFEGVYDHVVLSENKLSYDFYVRTCWNAPGSQTFSTMTTIIRLYNPEIL